MEGVEERVMRLDDLPIWVVDGCSRPAVEGRDERVVRPVGLSVSVADGCFNPAVEGPQGRVLAGGVLSAWGVSS